MSREDRILNIGCGTSRLGEDLSEEGFENITNIDFSQTVITLMEEKYRETFPKMVFRKMDAMDMKDFQDEMFNVVIDKGTLDTIMCSDNFMVNGRQMISEVHRVLKPGGKYICITYGDPEHRKKHFETKTWEKIITEKIYKPPTSVKESKEPKDDKNIHYVYILTKKKEKRRNFRKRYK